MKNDMKFLMLIGKSISTGKPVYHMVSFDASDIKNVAPAIFEFASKKLKLLKIEFFNSDVVYAKNKITIFKNIPNG